MSMTRRTLKPLLAVYAATLAIAASGAWAASADSTVRSHDRRHFTIAESGLPFPALADPAVATDRWWGVESGAGYRIEVPANWNGELVMYAHGWRGSGDVLTVDSAPIRRELVTAGYAWAASSYSANDYDVRAGIEDTNALAQAFVRIARANGRTLERPKRTYIIGHSMGGHIAAAAVEAQTLAHAHHKLRYAGALPMCGVLGDLELFDYFAAYALAAQQLANSTPVSFPARDWATRVPAIVGHFFSSFPSEAAPSAPIVPRDTPDARELESIVMNLSGGERPIFTEGFAAPGNGYAWSTFGLAPDAGGILPHRPQHTDDTTYRFSATPEQTPEEIAFNRAIPRVSAEPGANPPQRNGLRFVPTNDGDIAVPVLTLHNLGDLFVPFNMEQIYHRRVAARHNDRWLVQRAIRSPNHCDFTAAEEAAAFTALAAWVAHGTRPAGDDVMTPARVADASYGCQFTDNRTGVGEEAKAAIRAQMPACPAR
jgi:hypothetical protein